MNSVPFGMVFMLKLGGGHGYATVVGMFGIILKDHQLLLT